MTKIGERAIVFVIILGAFAFPARAQDVIEMPPRMSRAFSVPRPIGQLIQANTDIVLAAPIRQTDGESQVFVLYAKTVGTTNVVAIDQAGEEMFNSTVIVNDDTKGFGLRLTTHW